MPLPRIAIVGATGAVGQEMLRLLEQGRLPHRSLRLFASPKSAGRQIPFCGRNISVEILDETSFQAIDIALFSAGKKISLQYAPYAKQSGCLVIDNSSAFRSDPSVPLVIPEINADALKHHQGIISCPNCTTIIMLMALAPLHRAFRIKRIVVATYQAASGAGAQAMEELVQETKAFLENTPYTRTVFPFPYAFNLFTHNSAFLENGYAEEELKIVNETKKILQDETLRITATCVRVPILRAHSEALNVEFYEPVTKDLAYEVLKKAPGLLLFEDRLQNRFPMPLDATGKEEVYCGRIREDLSQPNTLDFWVVGDQLLKGAALNTIQIAEALVGNPKTEKVEAAKEFL